MHACYDLGIWYIEVCICCPFSRKCRPCGKFLAVFMIVLLLALASFVVVVRASLGQEEYEALDISTLESAGLVDDQLQYSGIQKEDTRFLLNYIMEFSLALLFYYPLGSFILFTGILGCGKLPILGGRPRDIYLESLELTCIDRDESDLCSI